MFTTPVKIQKVTAEITYADRVMTLGSCFAENIGGKLLSAFFLTDINPFGVLFNPISIANSLELLLQSKEIEAHDLFENRGMWQSFSYSSQFSNVTVEDCLLNINNRLSAARDFLEQTDFLLITFGTAWVYESVKSGRVVSNCHKLPASEFVRRKLSVEEIVATYKTLIEKLQTLFPKVQIIFSVSPIRHLKDGLHENNLSKSTLLLAIDAIQSECKQVHYFPSYEIQMDELRDYRFYAADMLHPSDVAVNYIWKRFSEAYFSEDTQALKKRLEQLSADLLHRPIHSESAEYKYFLESVEKRREGIITDYPFMANRI